jgi:hypothetical protein
LLVWRLAHDTVICGSSLRFLVLSMAWQEKMGQGACCVANLLGFAVWWFWFYPGSTLAITY